MIFRLFIDKDKPEEVCATVHERTALIDEIEQLVLRSGASDRLAAYADDDILMLRVDRIECFMTEHEKTYAIYADGKHYLVKQRLHELEQAFPGRFERIGKSALANMKAVTRFRVHLSGAVDAVFKSGYAECISRRCFAELKRRYGL